MVRTFKPPALLVLLSTPACSLSKDLHDRLCRSEQATQATLQTSHVRVTVHAARVIVEVFPFRSRHTSHSAGLNG
jgi:hypothetical protein